MSTATIADIDVPDNLLAILRARTARGVESVADDITVADRDDQDLEPFFGKMDHAIENYRRMHAPGPYDARAVAEIAHEEVLCEPASTDHLLAGRGRRLGRGGVRGAHGDDSPPRRVPAARWGDGMTTTITLDDVQLELVRRETMKQAASDLRHLAEHLDQLALLAPWPAGVIHDDVRTSRSIAEESLGTLDALGWPTAEES